MHIYLVGGAVRDKLLGRPVKDRDFGVVGATGEDFMQRYPSAKPVGRLGLTYIYKGEEYTLSRAATMLEDLQTRDLTVNALAEDEAGKIIGPPGALDDLHAGILRPVACENFHTDPHRVLRAARFAASFPDWNVADELSACMRQVAAAGLLAEIAPERVGLELVKACSCPAPGRFFRLLCANNCLEPWFGAFATSNEGDTARDAKRHFDWMDAAAGGEKSETSHRAAWLVVCAGLDPEHAEAEARRIKLSLDYIRAAVFASRWLKKACKTADPQWTFPQLTSAQRVDMLLHMDRLGLVPAFARAVSAGIGPDRVDEAALLERLEQDAARVREVHLPKSARGLGPESGKVLLEMRIAALEGAPE
ncbi:MAG: CCA tRNA nucleotidyltransferase [Desulfovibrio sp.]|uniref:CCA tRNA nucleotidyltransferase n=1 Tax=Desulfovibrio sp. 7SRBS1 TaxID=3378064 RepID=UPI003B414B38